MQVIEQTPALSNHHQQSTAGAMVFFVLLQVVGQVIDPLSQQGNLHVGRACIPLVKLEIVNRLRFRVHIFQGH